MNTNEQQMTRKRPAKLEQLPEETQSWLLDMAAHTRLTDVILALRGHGIDTSMSALSRFVRKHREKVLMEDGAEMKASVEALAQRGKDGKLRDGTLEALRQRLYERTLVSNSPEEAREIYAALVKEEARLKELELEARKVAALEQQVKLQGLRIQVMAQQGAAGGGRGRVKATEILESQAPGEDADRAKLEVRAELAGDPGEQKALGTAREGEKRMQRVVVETLQILNGPGMPYEKLQEARERLAEAAREIPDC
jgi:hypothetical protein